MWQFKIGIISEYLYVFLEEEKILLQEQKGCKRSSEDLKIRYYWKKQFLEIAKGEMQTLKWFDYYQLDYFFFKPDYVSLSETQNKSAEMLGHRCPIVAKGLNEEKLIKLKTDVPISQMEI